MDPEIGGYRAVERLGQGSSSETLRVRDASGATAIAKRLVARLRADAFARNQLALEAAVLRALAGRGAPRLLDTGDDGGGPWLVMEDLALPALATRIPDRSLVARVAGAAFRALGAVHEATDRDGPLFVVHGDLCPANLLVRDDPADARLVDFGLARFRDAPKARLGPLRGTVRFVAPEVARGEPATVRSDLFSLGLTLLHAASGELPRPGDHLAALVVDAGEVPVQPYAERVSRDLDAPLREALLAAVAFDPANRPSTAREAWRHGSW